MYFIVFIYLILFVLNLLLAIKDKTNKFILIITWVLIACIFISSSGTAGDAYNYKRDFERYSLDDTWTEIGYSFVKGCCYLVNIKSYNVFLAILFSISILLYYLGFKRLNFKFHSLSAVSMLFIVPTLTGVIRFFVALSVIVYALKDLLEQEKFRFFLAVIIASTFHKSAIFFLILLFCIGDKHVFAKNFLFLWRNSILGISCFLYLLNFCFSQSLIYPICIWVARIFHIGINKIDAYFLTHARFGSVIFLEIFFLGLILVTLINQRVQDNEQRYTCEKIVNINYLMSLVLPLVSINIVFYRLLILLSFINAGAYSLYRRSQVRRKGCCTVIDLFFIILCFSWLVPCVIKVHSISISGMVKYAFWGLVI